MQAQCSTPAHTDWADRSNTEQTPRLFLFRCVFCWSHPCFVSTGREGSVSGVRPHRAASLGDVGRECRAGLGKRQIGHGQDSFPFVFSRLGSPSAASLRSLSQTSGKAAAPLPQAPGALSSVLRGVRFLCFSPSLALMWASLEAQLVKNPPAMQETWVRSLGREDPLQKGKAAHSSALAWRIPWTACSMGSHTVGHG